jgi:hypothetical protein
MGSVGGVVGTVQRAERRIILKKMVFIKTAKDFAGVAIEACSNFSII